MARRWCPKARKKDAGPPKFGSLHCWIKRELLGFRSLFSLSCICTAFLKFFLVSPSALLTFQKQKRLWRSSVGLDISGARCGELQLDDQCLRPGWPVGIGPGAAESDAAEQEAWFEFCEKHHPSSLSCRFFQWSPKKIVSKRNLWTFYQVCSLGSVGREKDTHLDHSSFVGHSLAAERRRPANLRIVPNLIAYNSMISAYEKGRQWERALDLLWTLEACWLKYESFKIRNPTFKTNHYKAKSEDASEK